MSEYKIIQTKNPFVASSIPTTEFFERFCQQLRDMFTGGLDFKTIWSKFCEVTNFNANKPWRISGEELKTLNEFSDHEIYVLIGQAIGSFWKGDYKGEGF